MASAAPHCQLYLKLPAKRSPSIESSFTQVIAQSGTQGGCVLLCRDAAGRDAAAVDAAWADQTLQMAHDRDVAFLVEEDVELARRIGADGVHIAADAAVYTQARERLGADAIIGAGCGQSRHDAMLLAERGVDYVAFEAPARNSKPERPSLIAWWTEIFVVPCVAFDVEIARGGEAAGGFGRRFCCPFRQPLAVSGRGAAARFVRRGPWQDEECGVKRRRPRFGLVCLAVLLLAVTASPTRAAESPAYVAFAQGQYQTALKLAETEAAQGSKEAYTLLGEIYSEGLGVAQDFSKAADAYAKAADSRRYQCSILAWRPRSRRGAASRRT